MSEHEGWASTAPAVVPSPAAEFFARLVREIGLRHALIGGQAVNAWSNFRITDDYDFCVVPEREPIEAMEAALLRAGLGYLRRQDTGESSGPDFVRMGNVEMTRVVDLQTAKTDYQMGVIERAIPTPSGICVATPEDLIVLKLLAMRSQDQRDIAMLMNWNDLDWPYIEHWAGIWQVTDKLAVFRDGRFD